MSTSPLQERFKALPAEIRQELDSIRAAGRGPFGRNQTQSIVTRHFGLLASLRNEYGATYADIAVLLQACGITCAGGNPLTAATLSSAMSRAKARSARPAKRRRPASRNVPPPPAVERQPEGLDRGEPLPSIPIAFQRGQAAPDDANRLHNNTQLLAPSGEAPGIREDHHTRLIELLSQTMED